MGGRFVAALTDHRLLRVRLASALSLGTAAFALVGVIAVAGCGQGQSDAGPSVSQAEPDRSRAGTGTQRIDGDGRPPRAGASRNGPSVSPQPMARCLQESGVAAAAVPRSDEDDLRGVVAVKASHRNAGASVYF